MPWVLWRTLEWGEDCTSNWAITAQEDLLQYRLTQAENLQQEWRLGELLKKAPKPHVMSHPLISNAVPSQALSVRWTSLSSLRNLWACVSLLACPPAPYLPPLFKSHKHCCALWKVCLSMSNPLAPLQPHCHFHSLSYGGNECSLCFAEKKQWILLNFLSHDLFIKG